MTMDQQPEVVDAPTQTDAPTTEPVVEEQSSDVPPALGAVDPEKLAMLRDKLKQFASSDKKTISGSEAVDDVPTQQEDAGPTTTGANVNWDEYDLDFSVRHLYRQASPRQTAEGTKWVVMLDEFYSTTRSFKNFDKKVNGRRPGTEEFLNLGQFLNDIMNGPEGWKLISVMPASSGEAGLLFQRQYPYVLPDPVLLKKETEVEAPRDPELQAVEEAALAFAESEGLAPPPVPVEEEVTAETPAEE